MSAPTAVVRSTTGTAPITLTRTTGSVLVTLEDGSTQVYSAVQLAAAVLAVTLAAPTPEPDGWDESCGYWPVDEAVSVSVATNEA